jgi:hypothetical protein
MHLHFILLVLPRVQSPCTKNFECIFGIQKIISNAKNFTSPSNVKLKVENVGDWIPTGQNHFPPQKSQQLIHLLEIKEDI